MIKEVIREGKFPFQRSIWFRIESFLQVILRVVTAANVHLTRNGKWPISEEEFEMEAKISSQGLSIPSGNNMSSYSGWHKLLRMYSGSSGKIRTIYRRKLFLWYSRPSKLVNEGRKKVKKRKVSPVSWIWFASEQNFEGIFKSCFEKHVKPAASFLHSRLENANELTGERNLLWNREKGTRSEIRLNLAILGLSSSSLPAETHLHVHFSQYRKSTSDLVVKASETETRGNLESNRQ